MTEQKRSHNRVKREKMQQIKGAKQRRRCLPMSWNNPRTHNNYVVTPLEHTSPPPPPTSLETAESTPLCFRFMWWWVTLISVCLWVHLVKRVCTNTIITQTESHTHIPTHLITRFMDWESLRWVFKCPHTQTPLTEHAVWKSMKTGLNCERTLTHSYTHPCTHTCQRKKKDEIRMKY